MIGTGLGILAGVVFVLLALSALVVLLWTRSQRRERELKWRQLDSVYNNRDRRERGIDVDWWKVG